MPIENDPSSRMQVRARGEAPSPASCYVCGNGNSDQGYLDFGTFIDYHGAFLLCVTCTQQAADTIGYFSPEFVLEREQQALALTQENDSLKAQINELQSHVDSVNSVLSSKFFPDSPFSGTASAKPEDSNANDASPFRDTEGRGAESPKPITGTRRANSVRSGTRNTSVGSNS